MKVRKKWLRHIKTDVKDCKIMQRQTQITNLKLVGCRLSCVQATTSKPRLSRRFSASRPRINIKVHCDSRSAAEITKHKDGCVLLCAINSVDIFVFYGPCCLSEIK